MSRYPPEGKPSSPRLLNSQHIQTAIGATSNVKCNTLRTSLDRRILAVLEVPAEVQCTLSCWEVHASISAQSISTLPIVTSGICSQDSMHTLLRLDGHHRLPFAAAHIILQQQLISFSHHPCEKPSHRRKAEAQMELVVLVTPYQH